MERQNQQDNAPGADADPNVTTEEKSTSRRNMLRLGGLAAAAGAAGAVLLKPETADATVGVMQYGTGNNAGSSPTGLSSSSEVLRLTGSSGPALLVDQNGTGSVAIHASSNGPVILARNTFPNTNDAVTVDNNGTGRGLEILNGTDANASEGVRVRHFGSGPCVRAEKTAGGTGVALQAVAPGAAAVALEVQGRVQFTRSGVAVVPAGTSQVTVPSVPLQSSAFVLAVLQDNRVGVWVRAALPVPLYAAIVIYLNTTVASATKVGWFVIG